MGIYRKYLDTGMEADLQDLKHVNDHFLQKLYLNFLNHKINNKKSDIWLTNDKILNDILWRMQSNHHTIHSLDS